jgi:DNA repair exonuclease SbcCD ATPase subunit
MSTAAAYFETPDAVAAAAEELGMRADDVRDHLDVRPLTGSNVLQVVGKDEQARRAAEIANAVRQAGIAQRTARFQAQLAAVLEKVGKLGSVEARRRVVDLRTLQGRPDPTLETLTVATAPADAAWPDAGVVIPAGIGIGLGLAALILLLPPLLRPRRAVIDEEHEQDLADREQALERRGEAMAQRERELASAVDEARAATADEGRLARRIAEVTKREQGMARQAAELKQREQTLHEQEQTLAERAASVEERERRLKTRDAGLDARAHELNTRAERFAQRERELDEREAVPPEPEPESVQRPGGWTMQELDRAVTQHADAHHDRVEEWRYYLHFLREHADVDGRLPSTFDGLVAETFGEILDDGAAEP